MQENLACPEVNFRIHVSWDRMGKKGDKHIFCLNIDS